MLPRGIRNNNPLNIRRSKDQWQGLRAQQTDASFCQFETLEYGWRAAFYLLTRTYYHKYRLYTIRMIINKWAPPNENLTSTYIANVSRLTGIPPDEPIGIPSDQPQRWMMLGGEGGGCFDSPSLCRGQTKKNPRSSLSRDPVDLQLCCTY